MKIPTICIFVFIFQLRDVISTSGPPNVPDTKIAKSPEPSIPEASLTIFYDAMEEKSQVFFNTTLAKDFSSLSPYVEISFIPCQQAKVDKDDITCPAEVDTKCSLDIAHACAIANIPNKQQLVSYLSCSMNNVEKLPDLTTCASKSNMKSDQLQSCSSSHTGKNLCAYYSAQKVENCEAMPGFIFKNPNNIEPTDVFGHLDYYISNVCVNDFKSAVCAQLMATNATSVPQECKQKLVLGFFYKAMDEKSQKWFQSFAAVYEKLSDCLTIEYEPCMFAELSDKGDLDCKDPNDKDCLAAKTHACAVSKITDQKSLYQFVSCAMKDSTEMPDFEKCVTDKIEYDSIKTCASGDMGKQLCSDYSKGRPKTDEIPAFSYELTFDESTSKDTSTATDLQTTICKQMDTYKLTCAACSGSKSTPPGNPPP